MPPWMRWGRMVSQWSKELTTSAASDHSMVAGSLGTMTGLPVAMYSLNLSGWMARVTGRSA